MITLQDFRRQLDRESETTRKMLSQVPENKWDWKPHAKSMTLASLVTHIAELPTWVNMVLNSEYLDFAENAYDPKSIETSKDLLQYFEDCLKQGQESLDNGDNASLDKTWSLRQGETILWEDSKREMIIVSISQIIHHRAQLGVYLRLQGIAIPGSYGPSADEMEMMG